MDGENSAKLPAGKVLPSIVALACGMRDDGTINRIGTGFGVGTSTKDKNTMLIATCEHVVNEMFRICDLKESEGKQEGLIDNRRRIALFENGRYSWKEIGEFGYCDAQDEETSIAEKHDACILRVPDIKIPSLPLWDSLSYEFASEVMIIGYPVFSDIQTQPIMPYVLKTIISSSTSYSFRRIMGRYQSPRLALGCIVGGGFSGSPVISIKEGSVVGMIDYTPIEIDDIDIKLDRPSPIEGNIRLEYPAGITLAIPSMVIKDMLNMTLKWEGGTNP